MRHGCPHQRILKMSDYDEARKSLELTVKYLEKLNLCAAALLKEGLRRQ